MCKCFSRYAQWLVFLKVHGYPQVFLKVPRYTQVFLKGHVYAKMFSDLWEKFSALGCTRIRTRVLRCAFTYSGAPGQQRIGGPCEKSFPFMISYVKKFEEKLHNSNWRDKENSKGNWTSLIRSCGLCVEIIGGRSSILTDWRVLILCIIFHLENPHLRVKWYVEYDNVLLNLLVNEIYANILHFTETIILSRETQPLLVLQILETRLYQVD